MMFYSKRNAWIALACAVITLIITWLIRRWSGGISGGRRTRSITGNKSSGTPLKGSSVDSDRDSVASSSVSERSVDGGSRKKSSSSSSSNSSSKHRKRTSDLKNDGPREDLPNFIMLMGIPGSGKSTWAKEFVFKVDASYKIISSDDIRKQLTGNINDQTRNEEVWAIVLNQVVAQLKMKQNVILDATNVRTDFRRQFIRQLPACNRFLKVFSLSKSLAKGRISKDLANNVERSEVPENIMEKMHNSMQESMTVIGEEGWTMKI